MMTNTSGLTKSLAADAFIGVAEEVDSEFSNVVLLSQKSLFKNSEWMEEISDKGRENWWCAKVQEFFAGTVHVLASRGRTDIPQVPEFTQGIFLRGE